MTNSELKNKHKTASSTLSPKLNRRKITTHCSIECSPNYEITGASSSPTVHTVLEFRNEKKERNMEEYKKERSKGIFQ